MVKIFLARFGYGGRHCSETVAAAASAMSAYADAELSCLVPSLTPELTGAASAPTPAAQVLDPQNFVARFYLCQEC
jgi:hypothetical protein